MKKTAGMILCGGMGKRLRPLTEEIPKTLIEIQDNYTIMDKQLAEFKNAGVGQFIINWIFRG
ncbi:nucleotidyltransferase family protein [Methanobacterium alkalithermotolerans]|uniref:nucleotidyltransferase family protein n=1 Tax=Methanobacterium alkalithermotolerans TaxID=2731220 RepID=UPI003744773F